MASSRITITLLCITIFVLNGVKCMEEASCEDETSVYSFSFSHDAFKYSWTIDCAKKMINSTMSVEGTGWVAVAIGKTGEMHPSDISFGWVDDTGVYVKDKWATEHEAPLDDTQQGGKNDIINSTISGSEDNSVTTISFSRPLYGSDNTLDLHVLPGQLHFLYAYHKTSDDEKVMHTNHGSYLMNFYTGQYSAIDLPLVHGVTMLIMWGFLVSHGTFVASFLKGIGHLWFQLHAAIQTVVIAGTVSAFVTIEMFIGTSDHFDGPHNVLGLIVLLLVVAQGLLGYLANRMWNPARKSAPVFPDKMHWWNGRLVELLGYVNIFLGFQAYHIKGAAIYAVFAVWVAFTYCVSFLMRCWHARSRKDHVAYTSLATMNDHSDKADEAEAEAHPDTDDNTKRGGRRWRRVRVPLAVLVVQACAGLAMLAVCVSVMGAKDADPEAIHPHEH